MGNDDWKTLKDEKGNEYRVLELKNIGGYIVRKGRDAPKEEPKKGLLEKLVDIFREDDSPHNGWGDSDSNGPDYGG